MSMSHELSTFTQPIVTLKNFSAAGEIISGVEIRTRCLPPDVTKTLISELLSRLDTKMPINGTAILAGACLEMEVKAAARRHLRSAGQAFEFHFSSAGERIGTLTATIGVGNRARDCTVVLSGELQSIQTEMAIIDTFALPLALFGVVVRNILPASEFPLASAQELAGIRIPLDSWFGMARFEILKLTTDITPLAKLFDPKDWARRIDPKHALPAFEFDTLKRAMSITGKSRNFRSLLSVGGRGVGPVFVGELLSGMGVGGSAHSKVMAVVMDAFRMVEAEMLFSPGRLKRALDGACLVNSVVGEAMRDWAAADFRATDPYGHKMTCFAFLTRLRGIRSGDARAAIDIMKQGGVNPDMCLKNARHMRESILSRTSLKEAQTALECMRCVMREAGAEPSVVDRVAPFEPRPLKQLTAA